MARTPKAPPAQPPDDEQPATASAPVLRPVPALAPSTAPSIAPAGQPIMPAPQAPRPQTPQASWRSDSRTVVAREREQAINAASSPLSVNFELVGCQFATPTPDPDPTKLLPASWEFHPPCIYGKSAPDQDCRTCSYVRLLRVGAGSRPDDHVASHRYLGHGLVIPISEATADQIVELAQANGHAPLRRPSWEQFFADEAAAADAQRAADEKRQDMERRQAGKSYQG